jgi:hypothetical protein
VKKVKLWYTASENVKWCSHYKNCLGLPQKIRNGVPCEPAIPHLDIYPKINKQASNKQKERKKAGTQKDPHMLLLIAAFISNS